MKTEDRNKAMDNYFAWKGNEPNVKFPADFFDAIRECDKKARAWDALEKMTREMPTSFTFGPTDWSYLRGIMQNLLSTIHKTPLEELEEWANQLAPEIIDCQQPWVNKSKLIAKIEELKAKEKA